MSLAAAGLPHPGTNVTAHRPIDLKQRSVEAGLIEAGCLALAPNSRYLRPSGGKC